MRNPLEAFESTQDKVLAGLVVIIALAFLFYSCNTLTDSVTRRAESFQQYQATVEMLTATPQFTQPLLDSKNK